MAVPIALTTSSLVGAASLLMTTSDWRFPESESTHAEGDILWVEVRKVVWLLQFTQFVTEE